MSNRPQPRAYFYRNGIELSGHPCNGRPFLGFGIFTGTVGKCSCFASVTVRTTVDDKLTEADFNGEPVMVKVWSPEQVKPAWFAVANVETVDTVNRKQRQHSRK